MKLAKGVKIYKCLDAYRPSKIKIGENTIIGNNAFLDGREGLEIGENVNFSGWVKIFTRQHDMDSPDFKVVGSPVKIGDFAVISSCSIILPGISIGEYAVVMAGAVVTKDVPPYAMAGGIPAKFVRERSHDIDYNFSGRPIPFH